MHTKLAYQINILTILWPNTGVGDKAAAVATVDAAIARVPESLFTALGALSSVPVDVTPSWALLEAEGF